MTRLLVLLCALGVSGCGTIFNGTRQKIEIVSTPDKAIVATQPATVDYTTPTTLNLERKKDHILVVSMPGYTSQNVELQKHIRGGILVLDILAGLVGVIIDAATGAWYGLSPDTLSVTLIRTAENTTGPETITVTIAPNGRIDSTVPGVHVRTQ